MRSRKYIYILEVYLINLAECTNIGRLWVFIYVNDDEVKLFDSFAAEYIPK